MIIVEQRCFGEAAAAVVKEVGVVVVVVAVFELVLLVRRLWH